MGTVVLGWILIGMGILSTGAGITGGITTMFKEIKRKANQSRDYGPGDLPTEFIEALTEFLKALTQAPVWLALVFVGFVLIAWGGTMI